MKKLFLCLFVLLLIVGCGKKEIIGFKWKTSSGSVYEFFSDQTCKKTVNGSEYTCTYQVNNGVVDIKLSNGLIESGQINSSQIVIGSEVYNKGE